MMRLPPRFRRFLGATVLIGGLAWVGAGLLRDTPRETTVVYRLGSADVVAADLTYAQAAVPVARATYREVGGLPRRLVHRVLLPPGRTQVEATLEAADGRRVAAGSHAFWVPADGEVRLDLSYSDPRGVTAAAPVQPPRGEGG